VEQEIDLSRLNKILSDYKNKRGSLIPVLQRIQSEFGWVPPETLEYISAALKVFPSEVYGVVTFYSQFYLKPRGRNTIQVCLGTACYVKRSEDILNQIKTDLKVKVGEMTDDKKFSLEAVRCLGACGLAPVMVVNHDIYGAVRQKSVKGILNKYE
jgi:NADH-quinone oxidoreductase E subunit